MEKWGAAAESTAAAAAATLPRCLIAPQRQVAKSRPAASRAGGSSGGDPNLQPVAPASCHQGKLQKTGTASDPVAAASAPALGLAAAGGATNGGRGTPARPSAATPRQQTKTLAATAGIVPSPPQADVSRSPNTLAAAAVAALPPPLSQAQQGFSSLMAAGVLSQGNPNPQLSEAASPRQLLAGAVTAVPADPEEQQGDEERDFQEVGRGGERGRGRESCMSHIEALDTVSERNV